MIPGNTIFDPALDSMAYSSLKVAKKHPPNAF